MDWKVKTVIIGSVLLIIIVLAFIVKAQYDAIERLKFIETSVTESKELSEGVVRAQASYVTKKDLEINYQGSWFES
jgi:ABC-type thiamin/hydroxymethylpyrimidine transport system permease subunit